MTSRKRANNRKFSLKQSLLVMVLQMKFDRNVEKDRAANSARFMADHVVSRFEGIACLGPCVAHEQRQLVQVSVS